MAEWEVIDYDVWGNEDDGFWVNQAFPTGHVIEIPEDASPAEIVEILKEEGVIREEVGLADLEIEGDEDAISFSDAGNGEPAFELLRRL